jgi:ubiquinone/menaquinone biosynthesis C-methylase UbiE
MNMNSSIKYDIIRHCPGSDAITSKILRQIKLKALEPEIANLVCGTGVQAMLLAKEYKNSHITAVEEDALYFSSINAKAKKNRVQDKIITLLSPLTELPFEEESLDLILSEGAFEELDFGKRLLHWRKYIKPGGYLAMSELCLLTDRELPGELHDYFHDAYLDRELETIDYHIAQAKESGFKLHTRLILPDDCWFAYFDSMKEGMGKLFGTDMDEELQFYLNYKEYFAYVYFVLRRTPIISSASVYAKTLDKKQQLALKNHLIDKLSAKECSNTLRYTEGWLTDNIVRENHGGILEGFREEGGYCDCEVLANVFHTIMIDDDEE